MRVALIGTGLMGLAMAERLLDKGQRLVVFNRSREKAEPLLSRGAEIAPSAAAAMQSAECTVLMLTDAAAIWETVLQEKSNQGFNGRTVIQMGTIAPRESVALREEIKQRGGDYLEAPVLGSIPEARGGKLQIMVGASKSQYALWSCFLALFGSKPLHIGEVGKAAALKLAMNQLIASLTCSFALSLGFVQQQRIEVDLFMKILRESALYAPTFDKKLRRMVDRDYANPNFPSKHLAKDVRLFREEAQVLNLELSTIEALDRLLALALEKGFTNDDYSAVFEAVNPEKG